MSGLGTVHLERAGERIVAGIPTFLVELFLTWTATQPLVRWIEAVEKFEKMNVNGAKGTQSRDGKRTPIWDRGITGKGQIVGVADTVVCLCVCLYVCTYVKGFFSVCKEGMVAVCTCVHVCANVRMVTVTMTVKGPYKIRPRSDSRDTVTVTDMYFSISQSRS
jgi:hypothetical protein